MALAPNLVAYWTVALISGLADQFDATSHDFGVVAHGSVLVRRFTLVNRTAEPFHIAEVRSGCGCATPRILSDTAEPGGSLAIEVTLDTASFTGARAVSITADFDRPMDTVVLRVAAISRPDIVFNPGQADFGVIEPGQEAQRTVQIEYAGPLDFRIETVEASPRLQTKWRESYRGAKGIGYEVQLTLRPSMESGPWHESVAIKTNDPYSPRLSLLAQAIIEPELAAEPPQLRLGTIQAGQTVSRRVLLRGRAPFVVQGIGGETDGIQIEASDGARRTHVLSVKITPPAAGDFSRQVRIFVGESRIPSVPLPIQAVVVP